MEFSIVGPISINGSLSGYFSCSRGVRQGDPLSPLLFFLAEEVFSRGLSLLVMESKLLPMSGPKGVSPPSHVLFTDDIMVFLRGTKRNLQMLMRFVEEYGKNSRQFINRAKSLAFLGRFAHSHQTSVLLTLGVNLGFLPFTYLRVPIFYGRR